MVLHKETTKVPVNEFLEDWWCDLCSLNADAIREYSMGFSEDPICSITIHNARLTEDSWARSKQTTVKYDPLVS